MRIIGPDPLSVITTGWGTNPVTALSWVALIRVTLMTAKKTPRAARVRCFINTKTIELRYTYIVAYYQAG